MRGTEIRPGALNWRATVVGFTCTEILNELAEKLVLRLGFTNEQMMQSLASLLGVLQSATITGQMTGLCADPKDDKILECALVARATHVVSGDKRHLLSLKQFRGIDIVSPADFLKIAWP